MNRLRLLLLAVTAFLVAGCGSTGMSEQEFALVQAQMARNTLEIDCPSGCTINYRDPRDQVQLPQAETWAGAFRDVGIAVVGQTPVLGMYGLGIRGIDKLGDLGVAGFTMLQGSGQVTNTTTTTSTTTSADNSVGDYSGGLSGNQGQVYQDTSGRINSDDDYTSTPTVVTPLVP